MDSQIVASLFHEGQVVYKNRTDYKESDHENLRDKVIDFHNSQLQEIEFFLKLLENYSERSDEYQVVLARALYKKGMYNDAILIFNSLLTKNTHKNSNHKIFFYLGLIKSKLGFFEEAVDQFNKAIDLEPNYADYHNHLGEVLLKLNRIEDAVLEFQYAIKLNVYYGDAHFNLGLAFVQNQINKSNYNISKEYAETFYYEFETAVELKPKLKNENFILGMDHLKKKDWQNAQTCFLMVKDDLKQWDDEFILKFYLKTLSANDVTINEVYDYIKELESLSNVHPDYPDLLNELGIALIIFSKILSNSAIEKFKQALKYNKNFSKAKKNLKLVESDSIGYARVLQAITK
jgi:tetratricopeptide (TPR) repeat protein